MHIHISRSLLVFCFVSFLFLQLCYCDDQGPHILVAEPSIPNDGAIGVLFGTCGQFQGQNAPIFTIRNEALCLSYPWFPLFFLWQNSFCLWPHNICISAPSIGWASLIPPHSEVSSVSPASASHIIVDELLASWQKNMWEKIQGNKNKILFFQGRGDSTACLITASSDLISSSLYSPQPLRGVSPEINSIKEKCSFLGLKVLLALHLADPGSIAAPHMVVPLRTNRSNSC